MSPVVHAELSWLLAQPFAARRDRALVTVAGVAPDVDGLSLLGGVEAYGKWHHLLAHGFVAAIAVAVACGLAGKRRAAVGLAALGAFHLHILCDLAGSGPGWPIFYLWPFSRAELYWSGQWNLASWQNGVIGLATTLACLGCALWARRTPVELASPRWDAVVVETLRRRFARRAREESGPRA